MQQDANCYGQVYPPYPAGIASYSSTDTSICNPDWNTGTTTGVGPGNSTIFAGWTADAWFFGPFEVCDYTPVEVLREALCDILARRVDSVSPERALIGQPVDVIINGSGFGTGTPTVSAGNGITVSNVQLISSSEVRARFTIATNAPPGNHAVSVTTSFGQTTTVSGNFFVQIPSSLTVLLATPALPLPNGCSAPGIGTQLRIRYQINDQSGNPLLTSLTGVREDLVNLTILNHRNAAFDAFDQPVIAGTTESDGSFVDVPIGVCADPSDPTLPPEVRDSLGTFTQHLYVLVGQLRFHVRTNNFTVRFRDDCAQQINGADISVNNCP